MKPLAKLTLTRQRLYKKSCGLEEVPFGESASAAAGLAEYEREGDQHHLGAGNSTLPWQTYSKKDDDSELHTTIAQPFFFFSF